MTRVNLSFFKKIRVLPIPFLMGVIEMQAANEPCKNSALVEFEVLMCFFRGAPALQMAQLVTGLITVSLTGFVQLGRLVRFS